METLLLADTKINRQKFYLNIKLFGNFMTDTKQKFTVEEQHKEIDSIISIYMNQQVTCMLLQYSVNMEIKKDLAKGMKMLEAVEKIRESYEKYKQQLASLFDNEAIAESHQRINFNKQVYSQLSDAVLEINQKYFPMPARPKGKEYTCDEKTCAEAVFKLAHEYFPSLYENAA